MLTNGGKFKFNPYMTEPNLGGARALELYLTPKRYHLKHSRLNYQLPFSKGTHTSSPDLTETGGNSALR